MAKRLSLKASVRELQKAQRKARAKQIQAAQERLEKARKAMLGYETAARRAKEKGLVFDSDEVLKKRIEHMLTIATGAPRAIDRPFGSYPKGVLPRERFEQLMNNFWLRFAPLYGNLFEKKLQAHGLSHAELQKRFPNLLGRIEGHAATMGFVHFSRQQIADLYKMYVFLKSRGISNRELLQ